MRLRIEGHRAGALLCGPFSTTAEFVGRILVDHAEVPLAPVEAKAKPVPGSNRFASTPIPIGGVAITLPESALRRPSTLIVTSREKAAISQSIARPEGLCRGERPARRDSEFFESICTSRFCFRVHVDVTLAVGHLEFGFPCRVGSFLTTFLSRVDNCGV